MQKRELSIKEWRAEKYASAIIVSNLLIAIIGQFYLESTPLVIAAIAINILPALIIYSLHQKPAKDDHSLSWITGSLVAYFLFIVFICMITSLLEGLSRVSTLFMLWIMIIAETAMIQLTITLDIWESGKLPQEE